MPVKLLLGFACVALFVVSFVLGSRGYYDPTVVANFDKYNVSQEEYLKFAKQYAKDHNLAIYRLYGGETLKTMINKRWKRDTSDKARSSNNKRDDADPIERQAQLMQSIRVPGTSGTYAYTNTFYMFGKIINTALSVSYAPVTGGTGPFIAASPAFISSDTQTSADTDSENTEPPTEDKNIKNDKPIKANKYPQFYPNYPYYPIYPFNFIPPKVQGHKNSTKVTDSIMKQHGLRHPFLKISV